MNNKVYKITDKQLNVIVESQKNSPQLQTELFDRSGDILGKMLSNTFKNSVKLFNYVSGIKVEIDIKNIAGTARFDYRKRNPLAPLALSDPQIKGAPKGLDKILPDFSNILNTDQDTLAFKSGIVILPIKFKFLNLAEKKENQELQYVTWNLFIEVKVQGDGDSIVLHLKDFSSTEINLSAFLNAAKDEVESSKKENDTNSINYLQSLFKNLQRIPTSSNDFVIRFIGSSQSSKFMKVVEKYFQDFVMKPFVNRYNKERKISDAKVKIPKITTSVDPELLTNTMKKPQQTTQGQQYNRDEILKSIETIKQQAQKYRDIEGSEEYMNELQKTYDYLRSLL